MLLHWLSLIRWLQHLFSYSFVFNALFIIFTSFLHTSYLINFLLLSDASPCDPNVFVVYQVLHRQILLQLLRSEPHLLGRPSIKCRWCKGHLSSSLTHQTRGLQCPPCQTPCSPQLPMCRTPSSPELEGSCPGRDDWACGSRDPPVLLTQAGRHSHASVRAIQAVDSNMAMARDVHEITVVAWSKFISNFVPVDNLRKNLVLIRNSTLFYLFFYN